MIAVVLIIIVFFLLIRSLKRRNKSEKSSPSLSIGANLSVEDALRIMDQGINISDKVQKEDRERAYAVVQQELIRQIQLIHPPAPCEVIDDTIEFSLAEIAFLRYLHGKPVRAPSIAVYWMIKYHIVDFQSCIERFFAGGMLKVTLSTESLGHATIKQLQVILDDYALPRSGKKDVLIQRILDNIPEKVVNDLYPEYRSFCLTSRGNELIQRYGMLMNCVDHHKTFPAQYNLDDMQFLIEQFPHMSCEQLQLKSMEIDSYISKSGIKYGQYDTMKDLIQAHPECLQKQSCKEVEEVVDSDVDLHFYYNDCIERLYSHRDDPKCLAECVQYCKKDIELWSTIRYKPPFSLYDTYCPSFEKLEAIYEKSGDYLQALEICRKVLADDRQSNHEMWLKRYERVKKKLDK